MAAQAFSTHAATVGAGVAQNEVAEGHELASFQARDMQVAYMRGRVMVSFFESVQWLDDHDGDDVKSREIKTYSTARGSSPPLGVGQCRGQDGSDGCDLHLVCCLVGMRSLLKSVFV